MTNLRWGGQEAPENRSEGVGIQLLQRDLWAKFHSLTTEMIITKNGRCGMKENVVVVASVTVHVVFVCLMFCLHCVPVTNYSSWLL